jgi:CBS domain-containing protein
MRIADLLRAKGNTVATVEPSATVADLIAALVTHNVGAMPVVDGEEVIGIVSERDVVRRLHDNGPALLTATVAEIMTSDVTMCEPGTDVTELARIMTARRFRHLPVVLDGRLVGIVSIGDIVKARIDQLESEQAQLQSYIAG